MTSIETVSAARGRILRLALPVMVEMLLHTLVWIVDTAMVGRLGADALSAVGLGGQIYWTVLFTCAAIGVGTTALVARCTGSGDHGQGRFIAGQALGLSILVGLIIWAAGRFIIPFVYSVSGFGPQVISMGLGYGRTIWMGAPLSIVAFAVCGIQRATGDTRTPLIAAGAGNLLNIILDYGLVFGRLGLPAMGVQGAAVASLCAQILTFAVAAGSLIAREHWARPYPEDIVPLRPVQCWRIIRISVPAGFETILLDGARVLSLFIIAVLGTVSFAAFQVTIATESLSFMPGYAFAVAASILVGQSLGAGNVDRARGDVRLCVQMALWVMCAAALLFLLIPGVLVSFFTTDPDVRALATRALRISAVIQPAIAISDVYRGTLRGAGDTVTPLRITVVGSWVVRIPLMILAIRVGGLGLSAAFLIMAIEWWVKCWLMVLAFRKGRWAKTTV